LSYEEYVAMRAAQRAASTVPAPASNPPTEATAAGPPTEAMLVTPTPPSASAGEMTSQAPNG
jgi:hypothetical protein